VFEAGSTQDFHFKAFHLEPYFQGIQSDLKRHVITWILDFSALEICLIPHNVIIDTLKQIKQIVTMRWK
jgi:hypothetical protein